MSNKFISFKVIAISIAALLLLITCTSCSGESNDDFDSVFNQALKSSVTIDSGRLSGSGNIWKIGKKTITVITASHVIDDKEDITVYFWNGAHATAQIFTNNVESDYCLLTVKVDDTKKIDIEEVKPGKNLPKSGENIFMVIPDYNTASAGLVASPETFSEDFNQDVIYCYLDVNEGMSGGGLFDYKGRYLGLLLGGSDEGEGVFLTATEIH